METAQKLCKSRIPTNRSTTRSNYLTVTWNSQSVSPSWVKLWVLNNAHSWRTHSRMLWEHCQNLTITIAVVLIGRSQRPCFRNIWAINKCLKPVIAWRVSMSLWEIVDMLRNTKLQRLFLITMGSISRSPIKEHPLQKPLA